MLGKEEKFEKVTKKFECDEKEVFRRLEMMPIEEQRVFEVRWGLDGGNLCPNYKVLAKKLNLELGDEARSAYKDAEMCFVCAGVVTLFEEQRYDSWLDIKVASRYACLVECVPEMKNLVEGKPYPEAKEIVDQMILDFLTERERKILVAYFGLEDGYHICFETLSSQFGVTRERIRQIISKSLRSLNLRAKISGKEELYDICDLDMSMRTFKCLMNGGITTTAKLKEASEEDIKCLRNIGYKGFEEVMRIKKALE